MKSICMVSIGHCLRDDRIYYKEVLSLAREYTPIFVVAPDVETECSEKHGIKFLPLKTTGSRLYRIYNIFATIKLIIKIKPDICHFHDYEFIFAVPIIRILSNCKIIYDVHETYPEMVEQARNIPGILRPYLAKLVDMSEKLLSRLVDYIITSDDNIAKRFISHDRVVTIFNYPRLSIFVPDSDRVSQLQNLYHEKTPIIYQGGISEERGLFKMIDAMSYVKDRRPEIVLLIVGPIADDLKKRAEEEINNNGLQKHIDIVGPVPHEDIVNYIYISKIGLVPLLPTKKFLKNIPIKQFEYMACGIPVLGADLPPITSYINNAQCGLVFDSTNAEALAYGIIDMLKDKKEWLRMSEAGRKAVQNEWNWDKMEDRLFEVYNCMVKHKLY